MKPGTSSTCSKGPSLPWREGQRGGFASEPRARIGLGLAPILSLLLLGGLPQAVSGLELEGTFRQGGLVTGRTAPGARVRVDGDPVPVAPDGTFLLGFDREAPRQLELLVDPPKGPSRHYGVQVEDRDYGTQRIEGLPEGMVSPDPETRDRIQREQARIKQARGHITGIEGYRAGFTWPVTGPITGTYGTHRILNGEPSQPHFGVDIAAPTGTPVRAPANGLVRLAEPDLYFPGGTVILDHGWGLSSSFLHLRDIKVAEGEPVAAGEVLGKVGATGRATGPHLDWRMSLRGKRLDPTLLAGPMPQGGSSREGREATGSE